MRDIIFGITLGLVSGLSFHVGIAYASSLVAKDGFTLKSPDGTCAEMTIDNADAWVATPVSCP